MCILLHDGTCPSPEHVDSQATQLASEYNQHEGFQKQWGLDVIGADEAYGKLRLLKGENASPGSGVTIGFVDTGIDTDHPAFAGKTVVERFLLGAVDETAITLQTGLKFSHGTSVASIAAGSRLSNNSAAHHGVAWGADIAMFAIPLGASSGVYTPITLQGLANGDAVFASLFTEVLTWRDGERRVDILNLSFGYSGLINRYSEQELRDNFGQTIAAIAQAGAGDKTIFVWAAGNSHGDSCDSSLTDYCKNGGLNAVSVGVMPGLMVRIEELRGHSIAVAAIKEGGGITGFSNRCGIAADFCIAAPGQSVRIAHFKSASGGSVDRGFSDRSGTSYSAPMVAGGLALMKQLFRDQLSSTELVGRLLDTADNTGIYVDRDTYGRGRMDLSAATSPVGVLEVPVGNMAGGAGPALQATGIRPGPAFGDGLERSLAGREIAAFDALGAPFWFDLGALTAPSAGPPMAVRLREFVEFSPQSHFTPTHGTGFTAGALQSGYRAASAQSALGLLNAPGGAGGSHLVLAEYPLAPAFAGRRTLSFTAFPAEGASEGRAAPGAPGRLRLGFLRNPTDAGGGHLALAEDALTVTVTGERSLSLAAFATEGTSERAPASGVVLSWRPAGSPLGLRAGWIGERETMLGSFSEGAFGVLASDVFFAGVSADAELGEWRVGADAEIGTAGPGTRGGIIDEVSSLTTSSFTLHASRTFSGDGMLRVGVSQPLRIERGRASLTVPVGRTKSGEVLRTPVSASLVPSGRQVDFAVRWSQPLYAGELRLGVIASGSPGHLAGVDTELTFLSGWRLNF